MPDGGAQRLLEALQRKSLKRRVCVMSGVADDEQLYRLAALGAESFLLKPIESAEVESWMTRVRQAS
jgi:DNA-binding NarL/FixJ family response regulator